MRSTTRKNIALLVMTTASSKERNEKTIRESARQVQNALRSEFGDYYQIDITPIPVVVDDPNNFGLGGPWPTIWDAMEAQTDYGRDDFNYWHITNVPIKAGYSGWAYINSDKGATGNPGNVPTIIHELAGHQFGLDHLVKGETEYYDTWMGQSATSWDFTAPHWDHLGLIEPDKRMEIHHTDSARIPLVSADTTPDACKPGEQKIVYVRTPDILYSVSVLRDHVRVQSGVTGGAIKEPTWRRVHHHRSLYPGDTWMNMRVESVGRGEAVVNFNNGQEALPEWELPDEVAPITAGHFHDPEKTHQGIQVYRSDGQAIVYWFTWDETGPTFLIAQGPIENEIARLTVYHTPDKELTEVGEAVLYFRDDDNLTMKYRLTLKDRWWPGPGILQLERLTNPDSVDAWETDTREGVTRQVLGERELVMRWGYQFDRRTYRPRWLYGEDGILYEAVDGVANIKTDSRIERWGRYKLRPDVFRYRKDGWSDWKSKPLMRLI